MEIREMLQSILDKLSEHMSNTIIFGEAREVLNKTFIPVTAVSFGFGFGSGSNPGNKMKIHGKHIPEVEIPEQQPDEDVQKKPSANSGAGGGGGGNAMPIGMFEITEERTRFIPVISAKHIMILIGMIMLMMHRKRIKN